MTPLGDYNRDLDFVPSLDSNPLSLWFRPNMLVLATITRRWER